jgi:hypothetical protein
VGATLDDPSVLFRLAIHRHAHYWNGSAGSGCFCMAYPARINLRLIATVADARIQLTASDHAHRQHRRCDPRARATSSELSEAVPVSTGADAVRLVVAWKEEGGRRANQHDGRSSYELSGHGRMILPVQTGVKKGAACLGGFRHSGG